MKNFKSISEWLSTNPSQEEQGKIIKLINRGAASRARRELYMKENYLRKLNRSISYLQAAEYTIPEDLRQEIANVQAEIINLRKELPLVPKRKKNSEVKN